MRNPILSALGHTAAVEDGAKIDIMIGHLWLRGTAAKEGFFETYYRVNQNGYAYGPAISTPYADSVDKALHQFAQQLVGPQPRTGAVARKKEEIRHKARVSADAPRTPDIRS